MTVQQWLKDSGSSAGPIALGFPGLPCPRSLGRQRPHGTFGDFTAKLGAGLPGRRGRRAPSGTDRVFLKPEAKRRLPARLLQALERIPPEPETSGRFHSPG